MSESEQTQASEEILTARGDSDARAIFDAWSELKRARTIHRDFNSEHEGLEVIREELDELVQEARTKPKDGLPGQTVEAEKRRRKARLRREAIQVAAMGIRFATDLCSIALLVLVLAGSASAAFTPINPAPAGEDDLVDIVMGYCGSRSFACLRVDDAFDQIWPIGDGTFISGFEDGVDFDGNDLVVAHNWLGGILQSFEVVDSQSAVSQSFSLQPLGPFFALRNDPGPHATTPITSPVSSLPGLFHPRDRVYTWAASTPVPEGSTVWLVLAALAALAMARVGRDGRKEEIDKLEAVKLKVPAVTAFGESNLDRINAQINVIGKSLTEAQIFDQYEDSGAVLDDALDARRWLNGEVDDAPSKDWEDLAKSLE